MKNKLSDLNNHLFEQLERLNDEDLKDEKLESEIKRAKAITNVAQTIINNANTILEATKFLDDSGYIPINKNETLQLLGGISEESEKSNYKK